MAINRSGNKMADIALNEWAVTIERARRESGYPEITEIGRWIKDGGILLSDQPATCRTPNIKLDASACRRINAVHYAFENMANRVKIAIIFKYLSNKSDSENYKEYNKITNKSINTYYRDLKDGREEVLRAVLLLNICA